MSDREDLPFITHPMDDTPLPAAKPAAVVPKPAPPRQEPVDMVARPASKGTDPKLQQPVALRPVATSLPSPVARAPDPKPVALAPAAAVSQPTTPPARAAEVRPTVESSASAPGPELDSLISSFEQQQKAIQEALRSHAIVKRELAEARMKVAAAEHELAQLRQQLGEAKAGADRAVGLQKQLDDSLMSHSALSAENAKLKMRANELDEKVRAATAAREEAEKRIAAAQAALQKK